MNWRRGLVLAGINLILAIPMICLRAAEDARFRRDMKQQSFVERMSWIDSSGELSSAPAKFVQAQEEQTVSFSPCGLWRNIPAQESVVQMGNLPAFVVSEWREECPSKWSIARFLGVNNTGRLSDNFKAMRRVDAAFCVLIAAQWFLIGSFPLIQASRWWAEPGAFITTGTAVGSAIALIPGIDALARLPALIAFFAWLLWFGLLIWKLFHLAWQSTLGRLRRLTH